MKRPERTCWYKALGLIYRDAHSWALWEACGFFNMWSLEILSGRDTTKVEPQEGKPTV